MSGLFAWGNWNTECDLCSCLPVDDVVLENNNKGVLAAIIWNVLASGSWDEIRALEDKRALSLGLVADEMAVDSSVAHNGLSESSFTRFQELVSVVSFAPGTYALRDDQPDWCAISVGSLEEILRLPLEVELDVLKPWNRTTT
jgi:hypothetical protein